NKGDYDQLLGILKTVLGIEVVVSPRQATAEFMVRNLSTESTAMLAKVPGGGGQIIELRIKHSSPCVGKKIKDIHLPPGAIFVALLHKFKAKVPGAEDVILAGDRVVVIVSEAQEKAVIASLI
ncbi:MAG: Trk system potassium transporter TrkA, partial [Verrucomicrobia bacterium]|nr:Trk system potassium transporter TrkA [Verrucomicrobiota bacterium]